MSSIPEPDLSPPMAEAHPTTAPHPARPASLWHLLHAWLTVGLQSFGGGTATLFLIRRVMVEQRGWISDDDVIRTWAICQLAPGINLLALTILIGWRLHGVAGILVSLGGLLVPSVSITIGLTAVYRAVQHFEVVQAALRGIVPATIGLGVLTSWQLAKPLLLASKRENTRSLALSLVLLCSSGAIAVGLGFPIVLVLAAAGLIGAFGFRWCTRQAVTERDA